MHQHVSGRLAANDWVTDQSRVHGFPLPFSRRHSLVGPSCSRCGVGSPHSSPTERVTRSDHNGVPTFRAYETRLGWAPPQPRGRRCPHDRYSLTDRRLLLLNSQPLPPNQHAISEDHVTRHHQRFTRVHPSSLPLTCSPRIAREPLGLNPELRTQPLPATHVEAGTGHQTQARDHTVGNTPYRHSMGPLAARDIVSHGNYVSADTPAE